MVHYLIRFSLEMNDLETNVIDIPISNHFQSYEIDGNIFDPSKLEMKALTNNKI